MENALMNMSDAPVATIPQQGGALMEVESNRAVAEVQAMVLMAKRFPRDQKMATDRILNECQRSGLAEHALYSYARGGTSIQGPSIRLAEALARNWGNLDAGVRELSRSSGQSEMMSYCTDLETNYRQVKVFTVIHERSTKRGTYALTDGRDIFETLANQSARRLRAAILAVIPSDIVDAAVAQCEKTLKANEDCSPEAIKKMMDAFASFGVSKDQIEKRIQRRIDTISPAQKVSLRTIHNSIRDQIAVPSDFFEMPAEVQVDPSASLKDKIKAAAAKVKSEPAPVTETATEPTPSDKPEEPK